MTIWFDYGGSPRYSDEPQKRKKQSLPLFDRIHQQLSFLDVAGRADLLPRLAPEEGKCVYCKHAAHDAGTCGGKVTAMVDIDRWEQVRCRCSHQRDEAEAP